MAEFTQSDLDLTLSYTSQHQAFSTEPATLAEVLSS